MTAELSCDKDPKAYKSKYFLLGPLENLQPLQRNILNEFSTKVKAGSPPHCSLCERVKRELKIFP